MQRFRGDLETSNPISNPTPQNLALCHESFNGWEEEEEEKSKSIDLVA